MSAAAMGDEGRGRSTSQATKPSALSTLRLDLLLVERGLFPSREKARRAVMAGDVEVNGVRVDKAGTAVDPAAQLHVRQRPRYVSRGGLKLEQALEAFAVDPHGRICLDVGASTGGFTDCLLQRGAEKVYAIDVGYGQLDHRLRQDPRVVVMERTNARYLDSSQLPSVCSLAVFDLSFISLHKVLPAVLPALCEAADLVALIKPQFEGQRHQIGKGGIVRDPTVRALILETVIDRLAGLGVEVLATVDCETIGAKGNREVLAHLRCS